MQEGSTVSTAAGDRWRAMGFGAIGCLTLVLLVSTAWAQPELTRYESRHYVIHSDLSREEVRLYGRHMDQIHAAYSSRLSMLGTPQQGRQNLYLVDTPEVYQAWLTRLGVNGANSAGMYFRTPRGDGLAVWTRGQTRGQVQHTLQHEGFHQFADGFFGGRLPIWVNEGLAEYFGHAIIVKGRVRLGILDGMKLAHLQARVQAGGAMPLADLLTMTHARWNQNLATGHEHASLQYLQAWSVVHFLIHGMGDRGRRSFEQYLVQLAGGSEHAEAFSQAFGTLDPQAIERRWRRFVLEAQSDEYSDAIQRLEFLGQGLRWLSEQGEPMPRSIDALKRSLQRSRFRVTYGGTHGFRVELSSLDGDLFGYRDARGSWKEFQLDGREEGLPPRILAPDLRPRAGLVWDRRQGELHSEVWYE